MGSGFQRFRNTENTKNTGFFRLLSPRPGKGYGQQRGKPLDVPSWAVTLVAWRGTDREARSFLLAPNSLA
ncbi:hypothetical protein PPUJ20188_34970 [Pseudomonas putida]|nr:hypothetical protein PPUJ20188_34970 [Pseudomonas putida]